MSKVENLENIIERFGPHLHDAPDGGWQADRVIDKVVPTHCPYCGMQCGLKLLVEKNRLVGVEPRYDFPVNEGRLCPKGVTSHLQTHHPDRLLHPSIKRNGNFERASWDEALDLVVSKFKEIQAKSGKDALAVYSGSSLTTEKNLPRRKICPRRFAEALSAAVEAALARDFKQLLPLVVASGVCWLIALSIFLWWKPAARRRESSGYLREK